MMAVRVVDTDVWSYLYKGSYEAKPAADAWIAATALHLGVPLISHNKNHFVGVNHLTVISESSA